MISQSSSTDIKHIGIIPLIFNTLKRKWTSMLLIAIIMFFALPVPIMMMFSMMSDAVVESNYEKLEMMVEWSKNIRLVLIPIMSVLGVIVCCIMLSYLHKKVTIDFYHSLPIKRGKLFASQLISGYIILLVPTLLMYAAALLTILFGAGMSFDILAYSLLAIGEAIIYSLLFYALCSIVGVVTGVTAVHLILTAVAIFIVPLIYAVSVAFFEIFVDNMWSSWYLNDEVLSKLTPVIRFCINFDRLSPSEIIAYVIVTILLFVVAYFICLNYKSERSENSVIFPILGEVIKYSVVFPMTLAGGLLFYYMMNSAVWTIFGMICGGLLTFMLANTVLHKSAKAMFRGLKGAGIYAAVVAVWMLLCMNNIFGINSSIPKSLSKVEFMISDNTYMFTFTDKEVMEAIRQLYEKSDEPNSKDINTTENYWDDYYIYDLYTRLDLNIVFYPSIGTPMAKDVTLYNKNGVIDLIKTILNSKEFSDQYRQVIESLSFTNGASYMNLGYSYSFGEQTLRYYDYDILNYNGELKNEFKNLKNALVSDLSNVNFDSFQNQIYGTFAPKRNIPKNMYSPLNRIYIPISFGMKNTTELLYKAGCSNVAPDEYVKELSKVISSMSVIDLRTGEETEITDTNDRYEILSRLALIGTSYNSDICQLTFVDTNYMVHYDIEYTYADYSNGETGDKSIESYTGMFRLSTIND